MPTAATRQAGDTPRPRRWRNSTASLGSKSRYLPTTWRDSIRCAIGFNGDVAAGEYGYTLGYFAKHAPGRGGRLSPGRRHPMRRLHRLAAHRRRRRRPSPGDLCDTAPPTSTLRSPPPCRISVTSSTSTTITASRPCSSTAHSLPTGAPWSPIGHGPVTDSAAASRRRRLVPNRLTNARGGGSRSL